jgi:hypothetical protein
MAQLRFQRCPCNTHDCRLTYTVPRRLYRRMSADKFNFAYCYPQDRLWVMSDIQSVEDSLHSQKQYCPQRSE